MVYQLAPVQISYGPDVAGQFRQGVSDVENSAKLAEEIRLRNIEAQRKQQETDINRAQLGLQARGLSLREKEAQRQAAERTDYLRAIQQLGRGADTLPPLGAPTAPVAPVAPTQGRVGLLSGELEEPIRVAEAPTEPETSRFQFVPPGVSMTPAGVPVTTGEAPSTQPQFATAGVSLTGLAPTSPELAPSREAGRAIAGYPEQALRGIFDYFRGATAPAAPGAPAPTAPPLAAGVVPPGPGQIAQAIEKKPADAPLTPPRADVYLKDPPRATAEMQELARLDEAYAQTQRELLAIARTRPEVIKDIIDLRSKRLQIRTAYRNLEGLQAVRNFELGDTQSLSRALSGYTGYNIQIVPKAEGKYDFVANGQVVYPNSTAEQITRFARSRLDSGFVEQEAERAKAIFKNMLETNQQISVETAKKAGFAFKMNPDGVTGTLVDPKTGETYFFNAQTPQLNPATGQPLLDRSGKPIVGPGYTRVQSGPAVPSPMR